MKRKKETSLVVAILIAGTLGFAALIATPTQAFFNCKIVSCAAPDCLDGQHLQVPPGQCCPVCVPN